MLIAQISDCHVTAPGEKAYGRVETGALLARAIEVLKALPHAPDLVLATGDLAADGLDVEYATLLDLMAGLGVRVLPVVGNHDRRDALAAAFALDRRFVVQPGFVQYAVDDGPVRILVVDTITPGSGQPSLCADRLAWIEARLAEDHRPTLIAMHHPPFAAGVGWMEPKDRNWADPLAALVARHTQVVRVICGHVHRPAARIWAGVLAMSAPSTAHQVFLDLGPGSVPRFSLEAPGFLLHRWTGADLISYGVAIPGFNDTFEV